MGRFGGSYEMWMSIDGTGRWLGVEQNIKASPVVQSLLNGLVTSAALSYWPMSLNLSLRSDVPTWQ